MTEILKKHPDLEKALTSNPTIKVYKVLSDSFKIQEYWEKDKDGHWTDQTEREQIREQIEEYKEELEKLNRSMEEGKRKRGSK